MTDSIKMLFDLHNLSLQTCILTNEEFGILMRFIFWNSQTHINEQEIKKYFDNNEKLFNVYNEYNKSIRKV